MGFKIVVSILAFIIVPSANAAVPFGSRFFPIVAAGQQQQMWMAQQRQNQQPNGPSAKEQRGLLCYQQQPGWKFWELGVCKNPSNICASVKNCPKGGEVELAYGDHKQWKLETSDEMRGCVEAADFCESMELAGCQCKTCYADKCNGEQQQHKKMAFLFLMMMAALAMAIPAVLLHNLF